MKRTIVTVLAAGLLTVPLLLGARAPGGNAATLGAKEAEQDAPVPAGQAVPATGRKKLVFFGWGWPRPDFARKHYAEMEKRPFDGVTFVLNTTMNPLTKKPLPQERFDKDAEDLAAAKFTRFTDNFIAIASGIEDGWSWFNESAELRQGRESGAV
jgi:hypothetical protein